MKLRRPGERREDRGPPRARRRCFSFKRNPSPFASVTPAWNWRRGLGEGESRRLPARACALATQRNACWEPWFPYKLLRLLAEQCKGCRRVAAPASRSSPVFGGQRLREMEFIGPPPVRRPQPLQTAQGCGLCNCFYFVVHLLFSLPIPCSPTEVTWRRELQPTPLFLPGESHGQRSLAACSPWGRTESDMTEVTEHARTTEVI